MICPFSEGTARRARRGQPAVHDVITTVVCNAGSHSSTRMSAPDGEPQRQETIGTMSHPEDTDGWSRQGLRLWWRAGIRCLSEVGPALEAVLAAMTAEGYSAKDLFAVCLALEEALDNAIEHGHRGDPSKVVRFRCWGSADEVVATVVDQGDGFRTGDLPNPLASENLERPHGRGLLLMKAHATFLCYNARGNGLFFRRCRSAH
jgi:serine/threonine-protein kinase RsbW